MSDYGIRVSIAGEDVKTCSDIDCSMTSKFPFLKGSTASTGTKVINEGSQGTVTIAHGLGYIPFVRLLTDMAGELEADTYYDSPLYYTDGFGFTVYALSRADSTNVYLDFGYYSGGIGGSTTFSYKCFIFLDKGNLN